MLIECVVIIIILVLAGYMFIRSRRKAWFGGVFPLMVVPAVNIIFSPRHMEALKDGHTIRIIIYISAFIISSLWGGLWARKLPGKKSKCGYILCSIIFNIILIAVLLAKGLSFR